MIVGSIARVSSRISKGVTAHSCALHGGSLRKVPDRADVVQMAMPIAGTAQGHFDATLPNRRVEKDELKEWLKIVGEQNFLDDLGADQD